MLQSGTYTYLFSGDIQLEIKVALNQGHNLDVFIYIGRRPSNQVVNHYLMLQKNSIKVVDICGAAQGTRWHRKGLGALAVNTSIQFLKIIYPPSARLSGRVFDAKDFDFPESDRLQRQENRKMFWRTFGYGITIPDSIGDEHLCGTVGDLKVLTSGQVLGVHPRFFSIEQMHFSEGH